MASVSENHSNLNVEAVNRMMKGEESFSDFQVPLDQFMYDEYKSLTADGTIDSTYFQGAEYMQLSA